MSPISKNHMPLEGPERTLQKIGGGRGVTLPPSKTAGGEGEAVPIDPVEATLGRLRRAVARMRCIDDPDVAFVADGITSVLAGDRDSLDEVFGIRPGPGQRRPSTLARLAARNALYRQAAREFFPDLTPTRQAREIHRAFSRYEASAWRRDKGVHVTCPERLIGTPQALVWEILNLIDRVQSERHIRQILATS